MNKKQKWLVLVSVVVFLFVTLNPSVFQLTPANLIGDTYQFERIAVEFMAVPNHPKRHKPFFTKLPMYQYWACIAVPSVALFYYFEDRKSRV